MWMALKRRALKGHKFRRQHGIGPYVVDFYCPSEQLVVELDGGVHDAPEQAAYDADRQRRIEQLGLCVLRIPNEAVLNRSEGVLNWLAGHFR